VVCIISAVNFCVKIAFVTQFSLHSVACQEFRNDSLTGVKLFIDLNTSVYTVCKYLNHSQTFKKLTLESPDGIDSSLSVYRMQIDSCSE